MGPIVERDPQIHLLLLEVLIYGKAVPNIKQMKQDLWMSSIEYRWMPDVFWKSGKNGTNIGNARI